MTLPALLGALVLAAVHVFGRGIARLDPLSRTVTLSAAAGVSVAYVFVRLLSELEEGKHVLEEAFRARLAYAEYHVFVVALAGVVVFYGLEIFARRHARRSASEEGGSPLGVFWVHLGGFAVYDALVGYVLVHRIVPGATSLWLYVGAMALHFLINDHGLRETHGRTYQRVGRWVLAAAVLGGWALGAVTEISEPLEAALTAFLAGGIILNVLKEELPSERRARFVPFLVGAAAYTAVLLVL